AVVERQRMAAQRALEIPSEVFMNQSDNSSNAGGYAYFVRELFIQIGMIDAFVGCLGSGGSMTVISQGLKV
ncbi:cysteine synthase family protein, partial [Pectobacterium brasiliense]|nr:cysteine synthase family protein [Pectobacterium brasiliense]